MELAAAFILGLVGSLHCAGMCGPLAVALPAAPPGEARVGFLASRVAYNLGRVLTYCIVGVILGLVGRTLVLAGFQRWVSIALGLVLLLGLFSSGKFALWRPMPMLVQRLKGSMSQLLRRRAVSSLLLLGLLNGLLPCGLVYVAGAGAAATGGILSGAAYMAVFGLGTVPMMLGISLSGSLVPSTLRLHFRKIIPVSVFLLAMLLILRGMALGIPFVSPPDLANSTASCCHK